MNTSTEAHIGWPHMAAPGKGNLTWMRKQALLGSRTLHAFPRPDRRLHMPTTTSPSPGQLPPTAPHSNHKRRGPVSAFRLSPRGSCSCSNQDAGVKSKSTHSHSMLTNSENMLSATLSSRGPLLLSHCLPHFTTREVVTHSTFKQPYPRSTSHAGTPWSCLLAQERFSEILPPPAIAPRTLQALHPRGLFHHSHLQPAEPPVFPQRAHTLCGQLLGRQRKNARGLSAEG